jgi:hypothetical protein
MFSSFRYIKLVCHYNVFLVCIQAVSVGNTLTNSYISSIIEPLNTRSVLSLRIRKGVAHMSALVVYTAMGLVAVLAACFVHGQVNTSMARAKFVVLTLMTLGSLALGYVAIWPLAKQYPTFSLAPILGFGLAMWAATGAYSTIVVLCKRDRAPSA